MTIICEILQIVVIGRGQGSRLDQNHSIFQVICPPHTPPMGADMFAEMVTSILKGALPKP